MDDTIIANVRINKKSALDGADKNPGGLKNTNMYEAIFRVYKN